MAGSRAELEMRYLADVPDAVFSLSEWFRREWEPYYGTIFLKAVSISHSELTPWGAAFVLFDTAESLRGTITVYSIDL